MKSSRQRAAVVVLAVALPLVAVVVAVLARDDSESPRPLPVLAANRASGDWAAVAESSADLVVGGVTYEAGPDLPALDGTARAYRLDPVGEADVRRLAAAFGLEDALEPDGAGGWTAVDGEQTLSVYPDGLAWNYFAPQVVSGVAIGAGGVDGTGVTRSAGVAEPGCAAPDCSVSSEPVTTIPPDTTIPLPPPAELPSRDEAEAIARDVLSEMGLSVEGASVQAYDNGYAWSFTFDAVVDGVPTLGFSQSLSIGSGGEVLDGYGTLGTPVPVDEYPLTGTADAIERLNRGEAFGPSIAALGGAAAESDIADEAADSTPLTDVCPDVDPPRSTCAGDGVDPAPTVTIEPMPLPAPLPDPATTIVDSEPSTDPSPGPVPLPEPLPGPATTIVDPEPVIITLTEAEVVLIFMPAVDGHGGYLVPAYRFEAADGSVAVALAVGDEFLALPDGGDTDEPAPGTPATEPAPGSPGTDPDTPVTKPGTRPTEPVVDPAPPSIDLETRPTVGPL